MHASTPWPHIYQVSIHHTSITQLEQVQQVPSGGVNITAVYYARQYDHIQCWGFWWRRRWSGSNCLCCGGKYYIGACNWCCSICSWNKFWPSILLKTQHAESCQGDSCILHVTQPHSYYADIHDPWRTIIWRDSRSTHLTPTKTHFASWWIT